MGGSSSSRDTDENVQNTGGGASKPRNIHQIQYLRGHSDSIRCLCAIEDYRNHPHSRNPNTRQWFASGGDDGLILLWSYETGLLLDVLEGHKHGVTILKTFFNFNVKFKCNLLFSGSSDHTIRVWQLTKTGNKSDPSQCIAILKGHQSQIEQILNCKFFNQKHNHNNQSRKPSPRQQQQQQQPKHNTQLSSEITATVGTGHSGSRTSRTSSSGSKSKRRSISNRVLSIMSAGHSDGLIGIWEFESCRHGNGGIKDKNNYDSGKNTNKNSDDNVNDISINLNSQLKFKIQVYGVRNNIGIKLNRFIDLNYYKSKSKDNLNSNNNSHSSNSKNENEVKSRYIRNRIQISRILLLSRNLSDLQTNYNNNTHSYTYNHTQDIYNMNSGNNNSRSSVSSNNEFSSDNDRLINSNQKKSEQMVVGCKNGNLFFITFDTFDINENNSNHNNKSKIDTIKSNDFDAKTSSTDSQFQSQSQSQSNDKYKLFCVDRHPGAIKYLYQLSIDRLLSMSVDGLICIWRIDVNNQYKPQSLQNINNYFYPTSTIAPNNGSNNPHATVGDFDSPYAAYSVTHATTLQDISMNTSSSSNLMMMSNNNNSNNNNSNNNSNDSLNYNTKKKKKHSSSSSSHSSGNKGGSKSENKSDKVDFLHLNSIVLFYDNFKNKYFIVSFGPSFVIFDSQFNVRLIINRHCEGDSNKKNDIIFMCLIKHNSLLITCDNNNQIHVWNLGANLHLNSINQASVRLSNFRDILCYNKSKCNTPVMSQISHLMPHWKKLSMTHFEFHCGKITCLLPINNFTFISGDCSKNLILWKDAFKVSDMQNKAIKKYFQLT